MFNFREKEKYYLVKVNLDYDYCEGVDLEIFDSLQKAEDKYNILRKCGVYCYIVEPSHWTEDFSPKEYFILAYNIITGKEEITTCYTLDYKPDDNTILIKELQSGHTNKTTIVLYGDFIDVKDKLEDCKEQIPEHISCLNMVINKSFIVNDEYHWNNGIKYKALIKEGKRYYLHTEYLDKNNQPYRGMVGSGTDLAFFGIHIRETWKEY